MARIQRMGNCILDCTEHEFVQAVVGSSMSTTRAFRASLRMLITLPCCSNAPLLSSSTPFSVSWRRITVIWAQEIPQSLHRYCPEPIISRCNWFITSKWFPFHFQQQNYSYIEGPLVMHLHRVKKVARRGLYSTAVLYIADCALAPNAVPSFISRGATTPSSEGALY
jgi:hypothetical protein